MPKNKIKLIPVADGKQIMTDQEKFDLALHYKVLFKKYYIQKVKLFLKNLKKLIKKNKTFVVAGDVAANIKIREILIKLCKEETLSMYFL